MTDAGPRIPLTLRCSFCLSLNRVDLARAEDRPRCGSCSRPMLLDRPVKVLQEDFQKTVLETAAPVMVDFYADWCAPCRMLAPYLDRIAAAGQGRILVAKVDTDASPELSARYSIRSIPTVILFENGAESARSIGIEPEKLQQMATSGAPQN